MLNVKVNDVESEVFDLAECEIETVRRAASARNMEFDDSKKQYSLEELRQYGIVREGYNRAELRERGINPGSLTCFDSNAKMEEELLPIETPFGSGIRKWQLPIDMMPLRTAKTVFPPNTKVHSHTHPPHSEEAPGGGLRIVVSGEVYYNGQTFKSGDWFFTSNGEPYEFSTHSELETIVFYTYSFFGAEHGNRFSHPHANNITTFPESP